MARALVRLKSPALRTGRRGLAAFCFAVGLLSTSLAAAAEAGTPGSPRCWKQEELRARPGEQKPVRGVRTFDKPEPPADLVGFDPVPAELRGAIRRVKLTDPSRKLIALTFDLCEQPGEIAGYDGTIVDYLREHNIKATFFAGGKWLRSHEERARQIMSDPLFEIGNHSEAHRNLRLLKGAALEEEVTAPQRAYEAIRTRFAISQCVREAPQTLASVPVRLRLFRFPYGACNAAALDAVAGAGLLAIQWDVSTGDPSASQSAKAIAAAMLREVKPGSIVIGHANGRGVHMADALPLALPKLREKGFEFVTVSELLAAGTPEIASTCYNARPGDTDRYDHPFSAAKAPARAPQYRGP